MSSFLEENGDNTRELKFFPIPIVRIYRFSGQQLADIHLDDKMKNAVIIKGGRVFARSYEFAVISFQ